MAVDGNGGKGLLLGEHIADGARDLGKLRRSELGLAPCGGVAGRQQQGIVLAQRHVERLGEAQHHLPARVRAGKLQKAQMALGDTGASGELELRQSPVLAPPAQPRGKCGVLPHGYL